MNFNRKVAMITGAAVGIGRATAIKLAENGARLVLLDLDIEKLESVRAELSRYTSDVLIYKCDVSDNNAVVEVTDDAAKKLGGIDILVNNAALWRCNSAFADTPIEEWEKYLSVNIMGVVHCTKAVIGGMLERGYGKIINVSSVAGVYGNANMAHYSATKGALIAFTKALAKEVTEQGINVNCVSPGSVSPSSNDDVNHRQASQLSFMGRTGSDMENANLIAFLVSDDASYIAGQNILIDGCRKKM